MEKTKIALVQMESLIANKKLNLKKTEKYIIQAANKKTDIICFPETSIHGYSKDLYATSAESADKLSKLFTKWAKTYSICILAGFAEKVENSKPYITHFIAKPDDTIDFYRKTHLGKSELPYFTAGNSIPVFKTSTATIGIQICWDMHFPELSTIMSLKGAEIIFAPHASPTIVGDRKKIWLKYLPARAYDNAVFVATCNLIGQNGVGQNFCGGSLVIDPKGNLIADDFSNQESILYAELDPELINKIRNDKPKSMKDSFFIKSRRPELYKDNFF